MTGGLLVRRPFLAPAALMIFSFVRNEGFARGRSENFLVELEGGNGNKESWQDKIIQKLKALHHLYVCMCLMMGA